MAAGDLALAEIHQRSQGASQRWLPKILEEVEAEQGLEAALAYPFKNLGEYFTDALVFANLECSFSERGIEDGNRADKTFALFMPQKYFDALKAFDILSLANNHSMDYKNQGLYNTTWELQKRGIEYVGAGKNIARARSPRILTQGGVRI